MAPTKTREKVARPDDRAWVGATTRKRGNTAMKRNYDFGRDCRTTSLHFFYNPIHDFWDGSGYVPPGQSLPKNLQEIVEDILRRQVVSDDKLVLQPARQRKQLCKDKPAQNRPVKEKPYRVTKPRDARRPVPLPTPRALSLRSRAGSANSRAVAAASPIHSQITVADDEVEVDGGEAVNRSRRSDQSWAPSYTPASSPFVVEQNADCEPCERPVAPFAPMEGEANGEVDDGIDDTVFFPQSSNETPPVVDFTTMMVGDTWTNSNAVDFPGMAAFPDMMDFDMGNFDMDNFDLSLDLNLDGMDQLDHFETSPHRAGFSVTYPEASPSYDLTEAPGKQDNHEPVVPDVRAAGESPSSPGAAATTAEHRSPKAPPRPTSSSRPAGDRASPTSRPPNIQAGLEPSDGSATESRDQEQPPRRVAWNQQLITVLAETFREMSVHQEMRWDRPGDVDLSMGSRHQIATPLMMSAF
ncbi:hypothetical protein FoTM2_017779 [Fusarium oxysporum f. sp. vasinfectum]|nr:hypothetical protein FoTM2_017779 [Fusarium oxysporum f. sp. vasinfectum]